ncbi:hypothetical protein EGW08_002018 [Elysia chlorotica]|uniref:Uncharacterized protein n=1 Tax=Elysia chlorotica TaxID=188477 RepID=A0A433U8U5_ELYCH|nr:hypothetical protein EGW08_002018 [Elysia chlorotica]
MQCVKQKENINGFCLQSLYFRFLIGLFVGLLRKDTVENILSCILANVIQKCLLKEKYYSLYRFNLHGSLEQHLNQLLMLLIIWVLFFMHPTRDAVGISSFFFFFFFIS